MTQDSPKKGRKSWAPPNMLFVHDKDPAFKYLWESKDRAAQAMRESMGWERVPASQTGPKQNGSRGGVSDGKPLTTVDEFRELVLMRIPVEIANEIADWNQEEARSQIRGVEAKAHDKLASATQQGAEPSRVQFRID